MTRALALALAVGIVAACSDAGPGGSSGPAGRPSIVFLSIDTLGASHTSLHGYARKTTPHLEALASESVVFERCLSNAPYTGPSYVSQFTGLLPKCSAVDREEFRALHGRAARAWEIQRIPEGRVTLTELLRSAGYRTAAFVDNPHASASFGLGQGFELWDTSAAEISARDPEGGIRAILPRALAWIDGLAADEPFFLFVNALDVHEPYLPPADFVGRFADDPNGRPDAEYPVGNGGFASIDLVHVKDYLGKPPFPERMRSGPIVARYDEEVRAVDESTAHLIAELRRRGRFDRLLFVFSADHGEAMGEPDYKFGHGTHVEQVLHVPLLLRFPGGEKGGTRIAAPVQLLDLYPTLADWLGLEPPPGLQGRSLVPLLEGRTIEERAFVHETGRLTTSSVTEGEWRLVVTSPGTRIQCVQSARGRAWLAEHHPELGADYFALRGVGGAVEENPRAKRVVAEACKALKGPYVELYHVPSDPHLLVDVAGEHPDVVARLLAHMKRAQEIAILERKRLPVPPDPIAAPTSLEELKELGYAGDDEELEDTTVEK